MCYHDVKIIEELFEVNDDSIKVNGLLALCIEKKLLDDIGIDPIINDFA